MHSVVCCSLGYSILDLDKLEVSFLSAQVLDPAPVPALASDPVQAEVKPKPVRPASARTAAKKPLASKKPSSAKGKGGLGVKKMTTKARRPSPQSI